MGRLHLWILIAIVAGGTLVYYAEYLPYLRDLERAIAPSVPYGFARYSTHRILSILPVAYAAFVFGWRGGFLASVVIALLLLPRVLLTPSGRDEALLEVAAFFLSGLLVGWLIDRQKKEKELHRWTIDKLEQARQELLSSMRTLKESEQRLTTLNHISAIVSQSLELEQVLGNAIDHVIDVMQVEAALVFLLEEDTRELVLVAYRGVSPDFAEGVARLKMGEGFNGRVAETGEPLFVEDASGDPRLTRMAVRDENIRSQLIVPLKSKGKVVGTLCAAARREQAVGPKEVELLAAIGSQIGVAVENASLYRRERAASEQLRWSEERFRGLFENAKEAIFVMDLEGRIMVANRACEKLTGHAVKDMTGTNAGRFVTSQSLAVIRGAIQGLLSGQPLDDSYEIQLVKKDGSRAIGELMASLVMQEGRPAGVQTIVRDITEQMMMQENLRFYLSRIEHAQEEERRRVARELHDDTAQALAGLSRDLELLASENLDLPAAFRQRLEDLYRRTNDALASVRRFSQDLRPSILDDLGLLAALEWLIGNLRKQDRLDARLQLLGEPVRLSPGMELTLFRIAQEALNNVRKHSGATAVELTLDLGEEKVTMAVADNGHGFDVPRKPDLLAASGKLGLMGMQERARLLGGTLTVCSTPGRGTSVLVEVPRK